MVILLYYGVSALKGRDLSSSFETQPLVMWKGLVFSKICSADCTTGVHGWLVCQLLSHSRYFVLIHTSHYQHMLDDVDSVYGRCQVGKHFQQQSFSFFCCIGTLTHVSTTQFVVLEGPHIEQLGTFRASIYFMCNNQKIGG